MAELAPAGYQDLRDYAQSVWKTVAILDATASAQLFVLASTDGRLVWTHAAGASELELTITLTGSDAELGGSSGSTLPKTVGGSRLYKNPGVGSALSTEPFPPYTFVTTLDVLTIKHRLRIPQ